MDVFSYFQWALAACARPMLLEFTHPTKRTPLHVCGIYPTMILEVRDRILFRNGIAIGQALQIFDHLDFTGPAADKNAGFFPAFMGFFSYEFARYFGRPCNDLPSPFPDAYFCLFERGLVMDEQNMLCHDPLPSKELPDLGQRRLSQRLRPGLSPEDFFLAVDRIKERIRAGEVYQVNYSMPFYFDAHDDDMLSLYGAMRFNNLSPFMGIARADDWWLLSGSPERLFSKLGERITTRPIAGTKRRGESQYEDDLMLRDLTNCPKENAEHAMLVDLLRNDLNKAAIPGSVEILEDRSVEFYSHVMHLVSEVGAVTNKSLKDIVNAMFPGGTITGAPKETVMTAIADLEAKPRGPYTGSLGYISKNFGMDFNIVIRSVLKAKNAAFINAGAGIVIDSDGRNEWRELERKAMAVSDILANQAVKKAKRPLLLGPRLEKSVTEPVLADAHVFFMENNDSFSFNIVDAFLALGAKVQVAHKGIESLSLFSHVVIGPGPGNPSTMTEIAKLIEQTLILKLPLLGICLGHQAIGYYFGSSIKKLKEPVHGKGHRVIHRDKGLFCGLKPHVTFARYHSLCIAEAPENFVVDAYTEDDCIMALRHQSLPLYGVQFHPESYLSEDGHIILGNFLHGKTNY